MAMCVKSFSKYYYFPYVAEYQYRPVEYRKGSFGVAYRENFANILGTGEVLYGRFGWHNEGFYKSRTYCFISLLYIPLFPIGCYDFLGKRKMVQFDSYSRESDGAYDLTKINWDFREILYVYMKNWSFAVMVITVINTIMWDYVNPAIYG